MTPSNHWDYIPEEGLLLNKRSGKSGYIRKSDNMIIVTANSKQYLAHRVIFYIEYGYWPEFVDHIDGNRLNNHISNLREATFSINNQNRRRPTRASKTGYLGVSLEPNGSYRARLTLNGASVYLGTYPSAKEAYDVYLNAKRELHEGNTL